jgi:hypothetical protein
MNEPANQEQTAQQLSNYEAAMKRMSGDVAALCDGAAMLSKAGNKVASLALLWAAVGIAPTDFIAHRRLAAALTNSGDVDAAAEEYARYVEFALKLGDVQRAALELAYGRATLGDVPALRNAGAVSVQLGDIVPLLAPPRAALPTPERDRGMPAALIASSTDPASEPPSQRAASPEGTGGVVIQGPWRLPPRTAMAVTTEGGQSHVGAPALSFGTFLRASPANLSTVFLGVVLAGIVMSNVASVVLR